MRSNLLVYARRLAIVLTLGVVVTATARADVTCKDGTTSPSGGGACSHHGGVATGRAPAAATNRAPTARGDQDGTGAPPTVSCKDGTQSKGGRSACGHHGGVADAAPNARSGPAASAPAQPDAGEPAGVMCKDGTRSTKSGRGACSHHGGVVLSGDATAPVNKRAPSVTGVAPRTEDDDVNANQ
jgi:hypothetical protein